MLPSLKTDLTTIVILWSFNILFKGKLSSELNLNFMKFFPYSPASPLFNFLIRLLISSQSSVYFIYTSLFLSLEIRVKYLLLFFSSMHPSTLSISTKGLHCYFLHNQNLSMWYSQYNKYHCFFICVFDFLCIFSRFESKS